MEVHRVVGIIGNKEGTFVAHAVGDVVGVEIEAAVFEMEVDVGVADGVVAYFCARFLGLEGILLDDGFIVGSIVFGEIAEICADLDT